MTLASQLYGQKATVLLACLGVWQSLSPHLRPLVVMRQDVFIVIAFFGHTAGTVLTHADAVTGAAWGKCDLACGNLDGKVGGWELQGFPDGVTFDETVSDLHFFYVAAGAAADDFDIGAFDVAEGDLRAVGPYFFWLC